METKEELIKATVRDLLRIAKRYARIEALPVIVEEGLEVSTREAHTVQAVGEHERMSITQLAAHFGITKSAASQMAAKLVGRGFLVKKQALHSNREIELSLTPLGVKVFSAHERSHGKDMAELVTRLGAFSLSQTATLSVLLEALGGVMDRRLQEKSEE